MNATGFWSLIALENKFETEVKGSKKTGSQVKEFVSQLLIVVVTAVTRAPICLASTSMAQYNDPNYNQYQQTSDTDQSLADQLQQQVALNAEMYNAQLYSDPRFHLPPSFLDDPPRGPDMSGSMSGVAPGRMSNNQYYAQQSPQDAAWASYLGLPTGQTPPLPYPSGSSSNPQQYFMPNPNEGSSYPLQQSQLPYSMSLDSDQHQSLSASHEPSHYQNVPINPAGVAPAPSSLQAHSKDPQLSSSDDQSNSQTQSQLQVSIPQSTINTTTSTNHPPLPAAVIAIPGQPTPFGPLFYSSTGFDMIGILTRVANRKNPQVILGPVDFTCSFVVSDANAPDEPIIYASPTFVSFPCLR